MKNNHQNLYWLALEHRVTEDREVLKKISKIKSGIAGELKFKFFLDKVPNLPYLNNFYLNEQYPIEIDFLVCLKGKIIIFEIKHFAGDYRFEDSVLVGYNDQKFPSPFQQIVRQENEVNRVLAGSNHMRAIESYLVFCSDRCTVSGEIPNRSQVILPTEIHKLNFILDGRVSQKDWHTLELIRSNSIDFFKNYNEPKPYNHTNVKKGLKCPKCYHINTIEISYKKKYVWCKACEQEQRLQEVIRYSLKELQYIKSDAFTVNEGSAWCEGVINPMSVRRVCERYFKKEKRGKSFHYFT